MSMFKIFDVSGSAASAQTQRLNVVASNVANADTVAGPDGQAYKARHVVFQSLLMGDATSTGVQVSQVVESQNEGRRVHDPKHPAADGQGYVTYSNVNPIEAMVGMIAVARQFEVQMRMLQNGEKNDQTAAQLLSLNG